MEPGVMQRGRRPYRVPMPKPDTWLAWPDAFGNRFTLFVDTEEEFDWGAPFRRNTTSTRAIAAMPAAHARFATQGVPLTFLVDHAVASDPKAVDTLRRLTEDGHSAIGTQLHPWINPPFEEGLNTFNSFAGNLPRELERAKLAALTDAIARGFGNRPILYRAGRYGMGPNTHAALAGLGYRFDTSVRSAYSYALVGGPDFGGIGNHAYRCGPGDCLVELPLTTVFTGRARWGGERLYRLLGRIPPARGAAARLGLLSRVALTPEDMPLTDALEAIRVTVGEGVRLLNFSFHSPSVEPGHTPYVRDAADLAAFHRWWDGVFALLRQLGVKPASLAEIDSACSAAPSSARGG